MDTAVIDRVRGWRHTVGRRAASTSMVWCVGGALVGAAVGHGLLGRIVGGWVGWLLVAAAATDVAEHRLPNHLVGAVLALGILSAAASGVSALAVSALSALLAGVAMLVPHARRGVGMGDVKCSVAIGAVVGGLAWWAGLVAVAIAAAIAGGSGLIMRRSVLPLGPSLVAGWAAVSIGGAVVTGAWS